jgi:hypothetical protein
MKKFRYINIRVAKILAQLMVLVYATLGCMFLIVPEFLSNLKGLIRIFLGILLIHYAIFKAYRGLITNHKKMSA